MSRDLGDSESGLGRSVVGQLTDCSSLLERKFFHWRAAADRASERPKLNFATAVPKCISSPHKKKEEKTSKHAFVRRRIYLNSPHSLACILACLSGSVGEKQQEEAQDTKVHFSCTQRTQRSIHAHNPYVQRDQPIITSGCGCSGYSSGTISVTR